MTYQMRRGLRLSTGLLGVFAVAALGGCGGGATTATNPTTAVTKTFGVTPSGSTVPTITYNGPTTDSFTIVGTSATDLTPAASSNVPGFKAYTNGSDYLWVSTATGDVTARYGSVDGGSGFVAWSQYGRLANGTVPASGSANFTGNYGAVIVDSAGKTQGAVKGDVSLTANFGSGGTVFGSITNRTKYTSGDTTTSGTSSNPVTLSGATLDSGGNFSGGNATGGTFGGSDSNTGGSYEGLIGANGTQVSGGVVITHNDNLSLPTSVTTEVGAFTGN